MIGYEKLFAELMRVNAFAYVKERVIGICFFLWKNGKNLFGAIELSAIAKIR